MSARSRRTAVSFAVLLGMVYGLGAAPCGCWKHSGWRAAVALLSEGSPHPPDDADRLSDNDCHGQLGSNALPVERRQIEDPSTEFAIVGRVAVGGSAVVGPAASAAGAHRALATALPVRAELQVFRL